MKSDFPGAIPLAGMGRPFGTEDSSDTHLISSRFRPNGTLDTSQRVKPLVDCVDNDSRPVGTAHAGEVSPFAFSAFSIPAFQRLLASRLPGGRNAAQARVEESPDTGGQRAS